ncbi:MAG: hypothetical protein PHH37_11620 [Paludibacter sp.]|nr:hypothetical protein [Paludibacter sp.]
MKKYLSLIFLSVLALAGCSTLSDLTKINLPFSQSVEVPAIPLTIDSIPLSTPEIETNIDSVFTKYNISTDFVESVKLNSFKISIDENDSADLSFFSNIKIYITGENLSTVKIASATAVGDVREIDFTVEDVDLKDYILSDKFGLKIVAGSDETTKVSHKINIDMDVTLDAKVLGL